MSKSFYLSLITGGIVLLAIRLMRMGAKKRPSYRIVVKEKLSKRDGAYIESIGTYNPIGGGRRGTGARSAAGGGGRRARRPRFGGRGGKRNPAATSSTSSNERG